MKGVALSTDMLWDYIDHLGPIAILLGIPYLFTDVDAYKKALKYYPKLDARLVDLEDVLPNRLRSQYDTLLLSQCLFESDFETTYGDMLSVFVPHGNSDKSPSGMRFFAHPDLCFIYGQRMLDFLQECNVGMKNSIQIGNWRYSYYLANKAFLDVLMHEEFFKDCHPKKKRILYAPTWGVFDTTFFSDYEKLFETLPEEFELLVKPHPQMYERDLGKIIQMIGRYEERKNIRFVPDFPAIYPLLAGVDIYLGDLSSIGYDFLSFNRPLYFLNPYEKATFFLHRCGTVVTPENCFQVIQETLSNEQEFSKIREEVYRHTFGGQRSFEEVRQEIVSACDHSLKKKRSSYSQLQSNNERGEEIPYAPLHHLPQT